MTPSLQLTVGIVSAGTLALGGGVACARLRRWRRKDPAELERLRRLDINRCGRIIAGRIVDWVECETADPKTRLVVYTYEVAGVTYEAAQDVAALPEIAVVAHPGQTTGVKYDPQRPANSIIACEHWSGLGATDWGLGTRGSGPGTRVPSL